jgi:hypothetical protein
VLPLEKGPDFDEFFLTFDRFGSNSFSRAAPATPPTPTPVDLPPASDIGVRTFDEISASMSRITGVGQDNAGVQQTFDTVRQSLPAVETIEAFLSSHQVAIAQLAIEYCNAMINDTTLRTATFPGFNFGAAWPAPGAAEDLFLEPLLTRALGSAATPLGSQPDRSAAKNELINLIHGVPGDSSRPGLASVSPGGPRTLLIAKATCSAVLGSGAMLIQ